MPAPTARDHPPSDATLDAGTQESGGTLDLTAQQVLADQRQSWLRGRRVPVEDYLAWVPNLADDPAAVVDLIVREFLLREELGEKPEVDAFLARFPQYIDRLRRKFRADSREHDTIPSDDQPLCLDSAMTVLTADMRGNGSTNVEEPPEAVSHGSTLIEKPPSESRGSTHVEEPLSDSSDQTAVDPETDSPLRSQANPTSIIEATEALARELAEREGIGRELTPERAKLVERLKRALHNQTPPGARLTPGKTVPGYEIIDELGRGAVGVVYRARQIALNRVVALKMVLVGAHASRTMLNRFKAEAEAVASLQHGNIVQIHDIGEHDGLPYFSLEYCAGGSLADRLHGTPLEPKTAARIVEKLCRGMHYAHGCKVVHRDLKPGNILLHPRDDAGRPVETERSDGAFDFQSVIYKVSDFGLAKRIDEASHTRTGAILGTPSYMSPEQASGRTHDVGPPSDIYALGAILYELLTGRPPFRAATPLDTVVQVINDEPVAPTRLHSGVPADVETIALKCLQKDAVKRYATAADLADDLQRFLNGEPILARPIGTLERAVRWCRRNPVVAGLTGLAASLLVAGTIISSYFAHQASREAHQSKLNEQAALAASERAQRNSYVAQMNLVQRAWRDVEMTRIRSLLDEQVPRGEGALDFRGLEWNYWSRLANAELDVIRTALGEKPCLAYSADGRLFAAGGKGAPIGVWDVAKGDQVGQAAGHSDVLAGLAFLPDGRLVSVSTGYAGNVLQGAEVCIWSSSDYSAVRKFTVSSTEVDKAVVAKDGSRIALACRDGEAIVVNLPSGEPVVRVAGPKPDGRDAAAVAVALSHDNRLLAACYDNGEVTVREIASEKRWTLPGVQGGSVYSVAFSPDNRHLAIGCGISREDQRSYDLGGMVLLWEPQSNSPPRTLTGHTGSVLCVDYDARGARLLSAGNDRTIRVWDAASGQSTVELKGHERAVNAATFSPDGRCIASTGEDGAMRFWDSGTRYDYRIVPPEGETFTCMAMDIQSRSLAVGTKAMLDPRTGAVTRPASLMLFDLLLQRPAEVIAGDRTVSAAAFSADRQWLAFAMESDGRSTLRIWSRSERRVARELVIEMPNVSRVAFSDDGGRLIVAGSSGVVVLATGSWDVVEQHRSPDGAIADIAPTKSGEFRAISVSGNRALIWSGKSGFNPVALEGHKERITSAAVSADGLLAATGSVDRIAHVWDAQGGSVLTTLTGHVGTVAAVAFSPDGLRVATVGEEFDRTTRIWDRLTGQELLVLESAPGQNSHLVFGGRGERFAALRGGITIWDARPRNAESAREGAALSAVRFHCSEPAKRTQNRAAIALDPALSAPARRLAISLAEEVFDTLPQ